MKMDTSWESLFKPGSATEYFTIPKPDPVQIKAGCFSLSNAWWFAELSRLIYHPDFNNDKKLNFGALHFEQLAYIENPETSTHVALLKIINDSPCLAILFRGSDEAQDWGINARVYQDNFYNNGKVHRGFRKAYLSIKDELFTVIKDHSLPIFITGHSLGAALALLATSELYENKYFDSCYTFGSPRIGNPEFIKSIKSNTIYRVINNSDIVTTVPIDFTNIIYKHIGESYLIDEEGLLQTGLTEGEVYNYQKSTLLGLKDYAVSKLFNNELNTIKNDLPSFLADHAPINYVNALEKLLSQN